jgi:hypothetical protein
MMDNFYQVLFPNANSRDTYFSIHNVKVAHQYGKGKGVKVGVIDWLFGPDLNKGMYQEFVDVTNSEEFVLNNSGHGYWMALVLKEIAPECEIYAINACHYAEDKSDEDRIYYLEQAVDWAIDHEIDILTYSHPKFDDSFLESRNRIIHKAFRHGIITTFIHCDQEENFWPYGCFSFCNEGFRRTPDFNIYHFDYNILLVEIYKRYQVALEKGEEIKSGNDLPYFSFSSMSPVLGGFVAILKSIYPGLPASEYKKVMELTAYEIKETGEHWYDLNPCGKVVDIGRAAEGMYQLRKK